MECNISGVTNKLVSCELILDDMSSNYGVPVLPNEIIYLVIDQLRDDKTSLSACSLISKRLFRHSRSHLFASITIRLPLDLQESAIILRDANFFFKNTRNASQYVRRLSFTTEPREHYYFGRLPVVELFKVLESTNALNSLRLGKFTLDFSEMPDHDGSQSLPQLQELSLENVIEEGNFRWFPVHCISSLLSHFPSTSILSLIGLKSYSTSQPPPDSLSTSHLTELHLHDCHLPDLHAPYLSSLKVLTLDRICTPNATQILLSITPTLQHLHIQSTFSRDDVYMHGFADLTRFAALQHYTVTVALSDSGTFRTEAWRALTGPIPFLPQSLEHFSLDFVSGATMHDFMLKPIWALEKQGGWDDFQLGLLALDCLSCVGVSMKHDFEDEGSEQVVKYVKGCHSQLKEIIRKKWGLLDERGLLHFKSSCFATYDEW